MSIKYSLHYSFQIPDFNDPNWSVPLQNVIRAIDTVLYTQSGLPGAKAVWRNATAYIVDDLIIDTTTGELFNCDVAHTSAATGSFSDDRTAHPTYWSLVYDLSLAEQWATKTDAPVDGVSYGAKYYALAAAAQVALITNPITYKNTWDASAGTFPGGAGVALGNLFEVSVAGIVDTIPFNVGDTLTATKSNPSTTTYLANWRKGESNITAAEIAARLAYTPADAATAIAGSGLVTGGGPLTASTVTVGVTKAAGTDVTTGTDDTKAVTPKAMKDANVIPFVKAAGADVSGGTDDAKTVTSKALKDGIILPTKVFLLASAVDTVPVASWAFGSFPNSSSWDAMEVVFEGMWFSTTSVALQLVVSEDGGSTFKNSNYDWANSNETGSAQSSIRINPITPHYVSTNGVAGGLHVRIRIDHPKSTTQYKCIWGQGFYINEIDTITMFNFAGRYKGDTNAINAIGFTTSSGSIAGCGGYKFYGLYG